MGRAGIMAVLLIAVVAALQTLSTTAHEHVHIEQLSDATNRFALHLYQTLAKTTGDENVFFSPMSISTALAMTSLGARGETVSQMHEVLRFNTIEESRIHSSFAELNTAIFGTKSDKYTLKTANRLFGHTSLDLMHDFQSGSERYYRSNVASLDFIQDTEGARQFINAWVGRETENKIPELLPPGSVDTMTRLVLVNAIYFKADWLKQFDKRKTSSQDFYISESEVVQVPMMRRKSKLRFGMDASLHCKILELPYVGEEVKMAIVLPDEISGLNRLAESLTNERLQSLLNRLSTVTVDVELPRFRLEETIHMNDVLSTMGMRDLFLGGKADLSGLTGTKDLFVSKVIHKAFLEVNEEGSEAAAATGVTISARSISITPEFIADHPFLFFIVDSQTRAILFMGHYRRPVADILNHEEL